MRRGIGYLQPPVVSYEELESRLVEGGIISAGGLDAALAELIALGYLCEPWKGLYAFAVTDEELEEALAAEPVDAEAVA